MDKFGIFNLLNSFFPLNGSSNNNQAPSGEKTSEANANAISGILNALNNNFQKNSTVEKKENTTPKVSPPLQSGMLSIMNSHDAFIKRVKEKHPEK